MKVAVGLSGGVDSTVAALVLKEQGHDVIGVTMTLGRADEAQSLAEARAAADRLGIPLHVFDFSAAWHTQVYEYIRRVYLGGQTPNPCVRCNETVKFNLLPAAAFDLGCDRFATGHYARLVSGSASCVRLLRGIDHVKDQSYFLYRVKPEILARTLFPLGEMTKAQVRDKARASGLEIADKGDSQDFCGGDPMAIVGTDPREGKIVTVDGRVLGRHQGYWNYTIGKRKGLGIGGGTPYYVVALRPETNEVVVGFREQATVREFGIRDVVVLGERASCPLDTRAQDLSALNGRDARSPILVKVRSAGEPRGPVVWEGVRVVCPEGISGVAPGQSAVFYRGEEIVGGGIIV